MDKTVLVLDLFYKSSAAKDTKLRISDPKPGLTAEEVQTVTAKIADMAIFSNNETDLFYEVTGAAYTKTTREEIFDGVA